MCLAQGPQRSDAGLLESATPRSRVKHSTTESLRSHLQESLDDKDSSFNLKNLFPASDHITTCLFDTVPHKHT